MGPTFAQAQELARRFQQASLAEAQARKTLARCAGKGRAHPSSARERNSGARLLAAESGAGAAPSRPALATRGGDVVRGVHSTPSIPFWGGGL